MLSALFLLAAPVSSPSGDHEKASPVQGSLRGIVTQDDYPLEALDLNQQGSVGVLVKIDSRGAVSDCLVTSSSGSPALDAQTCRLVWLRAKFSPARDAKGTGVASTHQAHITWRIADDEGAGSQTAWQRWIVHGNASGFPSCYLELGGAWAGDPAGPSRCPSYAAGALGSLSADAPFPEIVIETAFSDQVPNGGGPAVGTPIGREVARLEIDAAGDVSSCKILETSGALPPQLPQTCRLGSKHYQPRRNASGVAAPFTAFLTQSVFGRAVTVP